jgi:hypothetical protein
MDELIKTLLLQMPAIGILLLFTVQLYRDMRTDAIEAAKQRQESIMAIRDLAAKMDMMIGLLSERVSRAKVRNSLNSQSLTHE